MLQYKEVCCGSWQTLEDSSLLFHSAAVSKIRQQPTVKYSNLNPNIIGIADLWNSCLSEYWADNFQRNNTFRLQKCINSISQSIRELSINCVR